MSLVGPWLSTISTKKRSEKITKKKQEELERGWKERNVRLKEMRLPKETFEQYLDWIYGKGSKTKEKLFSKTPTSVVSKTQTGKRVHDSVSGKETKATVLETSRIKIPSKADTVRGPCSSKPSPVYTGSKMIGIAQMHKSNSIPVFSDDEIIDISKMRR